MLWVSIGVPYFMNSKKLLFLILILAVCFSQFGADVYAPALPNISSYFNVPMHIVELSMPIYMIGVAVSQLIYGPLSEVIGRRIPFLIGLSVAILGSTICWLSPNIHWLLFGRLVQGCGAGACATLWRPVFRDLYSGEELSKYSSYLVIFIMFIIPVAPLVGGYIQSYFGWRQIFFFLNAYSLTAFLALFLFFKDTNKHMGRNNAQISHILNSYKLLLCDKTFMAITCCTFLSYGAFFSWFTTGPVLLIKTLGMSSLAFGWVTFLGCGFAYVLAGKLNGQLVSKFGIATMLRFGWSLMVVSGLLMLISNYLYGVSILGIFVPIMLFYFGSTFIWPNAFAIAFTPHGKIAGYAGALYGFMQISGGAIIGSIVSHLPYNTAVPLAMLIIISSLVAWIIYEIFVKRHNE